MSSAFRFVFVCICMCVNAYVFVCLYVYMIIFTLFQKRKTFLFIVQFTLFIVLCLWPYGRAANLPLIHFDFRINKMYF